MAVGIYFNVSPAKYLVFNDAHRIGFSDIFGFFDAAGMGERAT
jgi:hypothetical protein